MPQTTQIEFTLKRVARSRGGDRYEAFIEGEDRPMVIYVPQYISRPEGQPLKKLYHR